MKRTLCIILTVCLMLGLFSTFAFADTPLEAWACVDVKPDYHLEIYSDYVSSVYTWNHSGKIILTGTTNCYVDIEESGEYEVDFHSFTISPTLSYDCFDIVEGDTTVYAEFHGINVFENGVSPLRVAENSTLIIDVADNSSLTLKPGSNGDIVKGGGTVKLADNSPLPEPDADGNVVITKGTPAVCAHTYEINDEDHCTLKCNGTAVAKVLHQLDYKVVDGGHVGSCVNCGFEASTDVEEHEIYYSEDDGKCIPYCGYCDYVGTAKSHDMSGYAAYDDEYCINYCIDCGWGDEENGLIKHDMVKSIVESTDIEAKHDVYECSRCYTTTKEYDRTSSVYFELGSNDGSDWDGSAIIVLENGEPLTLVRNYDGYSVETYAIPYDKNARYDFVWLGRNEYDYEFSAKIFVPGETEPIFEDDDMSGYEDMELLTCINAVELTDEFIDTINSVPDMFEYYTEASVNEFVEAFKKVDVLASASDQTKFNKAVSDLADAIDALEPTEDPTTFGIINVSSGNVVINIEDEVGYGIDYEWYDYDGKYFIFDPFSYTENYIDIGYGKVDVTTYNLFMAGNGGAICTYDADVTLTALGTNVFAPETGSTYAGIEITDEASLTVTKDTDSILAIGDDLCAGIGSYFCYEDGEDYYKKEAGDITINGGTVFAISSEEGAGIGGSYLSGFGKITINGGRVYAECLNGDGAGIGTGDGSDDVIPVGGEIVINGGDITALSLDDDGAGIGGGDEGHVEAITINGGKIIVGSDDAACIGGGADASSYGGKIIINNGLIMAHFDNGSSWLVGNDSLNEKGEDEDNFVQINGGNFISNKEKYCKIFPEPKNKEGKALVKKEYIVDEKFADKEVEIKLTDGTYKATAYGTKVVAFIPIQNSSKVFKDVKAGKWYADAIDYNYTYGFIAGMKTDEFGVSTPVTRGMFITVLARIAGVDTSNNNVSTKFTDVAKNKYYTAAIKWASENNIVAGMSATTYEPNSPLQRQQLCVMIVNFAKYSGVEIAAVEDALNFSDASVFAKWSKDAIGICQKADIVNGYNEGGKVLFKPTATATRAEAAQILYKFHKDFVVK